MKLLKTLTSKVVILYAALAIMNIFFLTTIIFENQVELISDNSKLKSEKIISNLVNSLNIFSKELNKSKIFNIKSKEDMLNQLVEIIIPIRKQYSIFDINGKIKRSSSEQYEIPDTFIKDSLTAISNNEFKGRKYYLTINEKKSKINFYIPLNIYSPDRLILHIPYDISEINQNLNHLYEQMFLIIIVITAFHILFALLLFKFVINPIKVLSQKSIEIAHGDLSARVNILSNDEIGTLARSFDIMAESIQDKVAKLNEQMKTITETKERIEQMAMHDELTGLFNRRFIFKRFSEEISRAKREKISIGLLMIDVDHFKQFNDNYGHQIGDSVLQHVSSVIKDACRTSDVVGRYGGEEIVIIAPNSDIESIQEFAERIRMAVHETSLKTAYGNLSVTVSIGATSFDQILLESLDQIEKIMLFFADIALYEAKNNGRNRICLG